MSTARRTLGLLSVGLRFLFVFIDFSLCRTCILCSNEARACEACERSEQMSRLGNAMLAQARMEVTSSIMKVEAKYCTRGCSGHGECYMHKSQPDFPAICLCALYYTGTFCSERKHNPFRVQTRDRPHWPELMDADKQEKETQAWTRTVGVACGGDRHASTCPGCMTTIGRRSGSPGGCGGECLLDNNGQCVLNVKAGSVAKPTPRRPRLRPFGSAKRKGKGGGGLLSGGSGAKAGGAYPYTKAGARPAKAALGRSLEEVEPGIGETMEAWRSRYCRRLFAGHEPSRAAPGLAFDRSRGVYTPRSAPGQQVRIRYLRTVEDTPILARARTHVAHVRTRTHTYAHVRTSYRCASAGCRQSRIPSTSAG